MGALVAVFLMAFLPAAAGIMKAGFVCTTLLASAGTLHNLLLVESRVLNLGPVMSLVWAMTLAAIP